MGNLEDERRAIAAHELARQTLASPSDRAVVILFAPALDYRGPHIQRCRLEYYVNATYAEVVSQPFHHHRITSLAGASFVNEWAVFGPHGGDDADKDPGGWWLDGRNGPSRASRLLDGGWHATYADAIKALRQKMEIRVEDARRALHAACELRDASYRLAHREEEAWRRGELRPSRAADERLPAEPDHD